MRWKEIKKRKNQPDKLCEVSVGISHSRGSPQIVLCRKTARWLCFHDDPPWCIPALVCDDCRPKIEDEENKKCE